MACPQQARQARPLVGCPAAHFQLLHVSLRPGHSPLAPAAAAACHRQQALPCALPHAAPAAAGHAVHALQTKQPLQLHRRLQPQHQAHLPCRPSGVDHKAVHGLSRSCRAAAPSQAFAADDDGGSSSSGGGSKSGVFAAAAALARGLSDTATDLQELIQRFLSLWRQFLPMLSLFFCLSFINTILDSLKDTLVITAVGGGAFVIPYLTVYAVLPMSMVFLVAFSAASQRMSRSALFNSIVAIFVAFFGGFALFLYPNANVLHPHALADQLQQVLPQGLAGLVGMVRNWTFTLFFCMSELWGDVCMGLLFWGLANEITNLSDAATLYPLFGLGANLAQALAGMVLKATTRGGATEFASALQASMAAVVCIACVAIMLQQHITNQAEAAAAAQRHRHLHRHNSSTMASAADLSRAASPGNNAASAAPPTQTQQQQQQSEGQASKQQSSLRDSFKVLAASVELRCLAVMSLAQGLCNSLMEFAWKCHMRLLYPSPADFTAFLGDVATWSGVVTGGLMLLSPLLFERLGWRGVAGATPKILLFGGSAFFCACIAYQHLFGHVVAASGATAAGPAGVALLQGLVIFGALLYVFGRGAKFSLFKPAEEMVYITLDEDGRTRGKAAIDVVGSQTGKSGGSLLQQALLITSAGSIVGIMPVLFAVFFVMLRGWTSAVHTLSSVRHYSYDSPISSLDEDEGDTQPPQAVLAAAAAAPAVGSGSSSLQPADQQELLEQLQKLADANGSSDGADGSSSNSHSQGSKAFRAAVARSSTSSTSSSSSSDGTGKSSSNGIAEGDAPSSIDDISSDGSSHSWNGVSSNGSKAQEHNLEFITLSHDAARAFRQNRRDAAGGPGHGSIDDGGSSSSGPSEDAAGSVSSRVSQGGDGGNA